jgi:hypothetical protein
MLLEYKNEKLEKESGLLRVRFFRKLSGVNQRLISAFKTASASVIVSSEFSLWSFGHWSCD